MRNYQPHKHNPYWLRPKLYRRVIALVQDYDGMRQERVNIIHDTPVPDGMPRGSAVSDPTANKAMRLIELDKDIGAVERALNAILPEYRKSVFDLVITGRVPIDTYAHRTTIWRWKAKFLYSVAQNKFWV